jgi:hypothetical protein
MQSPMLRRTVFNVYLRDGLYSKSVGEGQGVVKWKPCLSTHIWVDFFRNAYLRR